MDLPAVVACGYRRVKIPKSGNSFPAFLVAFEARHPTSSKAKCGVGTNIQDRIRPCRGIRFAWRSKKDFQLLARNSVDAQDKTLPKAAMKKVVEETIVPWRRSSLSQRKDDTEQDGACQISDGAIPVCLSDQNLPNHFSARMKKSVWQLDRFLQTMQSKAGDSEQRQHAWEIFGRFSDTEDLVTPPEFLAFGTSGSATQDANTHDSDGQAANEKTSCDVSSAADAATNNKTIDSSTTLKDSSRLGQYFASKENSRKVVECALEKILPLYRRGDSGNDKQSRCTTKIVFVEPSCGHGDIIVSLVEALKEHNISPSTVRIMGYDIDPGAIQTCRQREEFRAAKNIVDSPNENEHQSYNNYRILWECKSFFETTRAHCIRVLDTFFNENNDETTDCSIANDREVLVCCLGGPPYTTGQGSGKAMKRDLPERFVDHCFREWKADVVSFLLPARYKEGMKNISIDGMLVTKPQDRAFATMAEGSTDFWIEETQELKESTFFFRGTTKVTQPSIIKIFHARKHLD